MSVSETEHTLPLRVPLPPGPEAPPDPAEPQTSPHDGKLSRRERAVLLLSLGHFANDTYPGFLAPLQPLLMQQAGYGLTIAGLLTSIGSISGSIMQPLFGLLSDRMRYPWLVILGPLLTALIFGTIGWWHDWRALALVVFLGGLGTAAFHPQAAAMAGKGSENRRGLVMSLFITGGNFGSALGPILILTVVSLWGMRASMVTSLFGAGVALLLWRTLPHRVAHHHTATNSPFTWQMLRSSRFAALLLVWLVVLIRAFIISGITTFSPIYLTTRGYSVLLAGAANTVFGISGSFGGLLGGGLSDRIGRKRVIVLSLAGALPAFWLFLQTSSIWGLILLGLSGFMLFSSISVNIVMGQDLFPQQAGTISSLMMGLAWGLGGLLITPLGAAAERFGVAAALHSLLLVILLGLGLALFIPAAAPQKGGDSQ